MRNVLVAAADGFFYTSKEVLDRCRLVLSPSYGPDADTYFVFFQDYPLARAQPLFRVLEYLHEEPYNRYEEENNMQYPLQSEERLPLLQLLAELKDECYFWPIILEPQTAEEASQFLPLVLRHWLPHVRDVDYDSALTMLLRRIAQGGEGLFPELAAPEWRQLWELYTEGFRPFGLTCNLQGYFEIYEAQLNFALLFRRTGLSADFLFGPQTDSVIRGAADLLLPVVQNSELKQRLKALLSGCRASQLLALPLTYRA